MRIGFARAALAALSATAALDASAQATGAGTVCVLGAPGAAGRADLQAVLLRAVRSEVDKLGVGPVIPTPALDLDALQLAVGCVGESPGCFQALATQLRADTLVIVRVADLDRGFELQLERIHGSSGQSGGAERRRAKEDRGGAGVLDAVPGAVRALFGFPPLAPPPVALHPGPSWKPFAVAGAGTAVMVAAAIAGAMSASAQSDYAERAIRTAGDADLALDDLDRAEGRATASNVLWAIGGALVAGGASWLLVELWSDPEEVRP